MSPEERSFETRPHEPQPCEPQPREPRAPGRRVSETPNKPADPRIRERARAFAARHPELLRRLAEG